MAADTVVRTIGLPLQSLWGVVAPGRIPLVLCEDNSATIIVCQTGKTTMRHLGRTHKVQVSWLYERFKEPGITIAKETSIWQRADVFTKPFLLAEMWHWVRKLVGVGSKAEIHQNGGLPLRPDMISGGNVAESLIHKSNTARTDSTCDRDGNATVSCPCVSIRVHASPHPPERVVAAGRAPIVALCTGTRMHVRSCTVS